MLGMMSCSDDEMPPSDTEEQLPSRGDQPHLRFEISSDDGFSVEADSIEGNLRHFFISSVNVSKIFFKSLGETMCIEQCSQGKETGQYWHIPSL